MKMALIALDAALAKREHFWHNTQEDPHGIASAMIAALSEVRGAIQDVIKDPEVEPKAAQSAEPRLETTPGYNPPRDIYNPQDKL